MSTLAACLTVAAVIGFSLPAAYWQIRRAHSIESERDRIVREAHQRADLAAKIDGLEIAWRLPAYDPELDAGCDRLRQAIRDHREEDTP
jgi:hypothetical protein